LSLLVCVSVLLTGWLAGWYYLWMDGFYWLVMRNECRMV